jgi:hypothetical protein
VQYPPLSSNDINAVVCKKIGALETDGKMMFWVDMTFLEFRPPKLIPTATPKGATDRLGVPTPQSKIDIAIAGEAALAEAARLAAEEAERQRVEAARIRAEREAEIARQAAEAARIAAEEAAAVEVNAKVRKMK